jgi:hypothetical protein
LIEFLQPLAVSLRIAFSQQRHSHHGEASTSLFRRQLSSQS